MLPFVFDVFVPVAKEEAREDFRLHWILVGGVEAFLIGLVGFLERLLGVFWPDRRDKGDLLAVARPCAGRSAGADRGELFCFAAVNRNDPELARSGARRFEQNPLAVRAPARRPIALGG